MLPAALQVTYGRTLLKDLMGGGGGGGGDNKTQTNKI